MVSNREQHAANLRTLVKDYGGNKALAAAINRRLDVDDKPIDPTQISNALSGHRVFGEKLRRKIERALELGDYWFDHDNSGLVPFITINGAAVSPAAAWLACVFDRMPPAHREVFFVSVQAHAKTWAPELLAIEPALNLSPVTGAHTDVKKAGRRKRRSNLSTIAISESVTGGD